MCKGPCVFFVLFLTTTLTTVMSLPRYQTCPVNLGLAMLGLSVLGSTIFGIISLQAMSICCQTRYWDKVCMFAAFVLTILFSINMVIAFVYVLIIQIKDHSCIPIGLLLINWIVTSIGTGVLLILVIAITCYLFATIKERYEIRRTQKELEQLYTIIYNPKINVDRLVERFKDKLMTEPLQESEIAVLRDSFGEHYKTSQGHLEYELRESCVICLEAFERDEEMIRFPICGHQYNWVCLQKWLGQQLSCPMCKRELRISMIKAVRSKGKPIAK